MLIENTKDIKPENNLVMIIYGRGGVGKTTFAASAPKPLLLDFENGSKYLGDRGINISVARFDKWLTAKDKQELSNVLPQFESIIIDPLGDVMDKIIDSETISGRKYRMADGGLTIAGWGEAKRQLKSFIEWLRDSKKNVIIVSHVSEIQTEQGLEHRIQVATKLKDKIPDMVDIISFLGIRLKKGTEDEYERTLYTPAQGGNFDSKDRTGHIPNSVVISERNGWNDLLKAIETTKRSKMEEN